MRNHKVNKYVVVGLLLRSVKYLITISDSLACFISGISVSLIGFGVYAMNSDLTRLGNWKKKLVKNIMGTN